MHNGYYGKQQNANLRGQNASLGFPDRVKLHRPNYQGNAPILKLSPMPAIDGLCIMKSSGDRVVTRQSPM